MELRQLQYFAAVARHGHVTRAAEDLYVTQSALSQQIRRLEDELGVALLRRTPRGVELTAAGAELLERAEVILDQAARARAAMDEHAGAVRGVARVAATPGDAVALPAALAAFHGEHPGIQLALRHAAAADVVALVQRGSVDVGVAALPRGEAPAGIAVTPLPAEPLRVIAAPGDPLVAGGRGSPAALRGAARVLPEPGSALRETVLEACAGAGFSPIPRFEVADPATVRFLVHAGLAAAVVPASWLALAGAEVATAELDAPGAAHGAALVTAAGGPSPAGGLLHEALRRTLGSEGRVELALEAAPRPGADEPQDGGAAAEEDERGG
jgi:DNA-binding transcriptional LysR family regulator